MNSIFELSLSELSNILKNKGKKGFVAKQLFDWVYKKKVVDPEKMNNLSKDIRQFLKEELSFFLPEVVKKEISKDKTEKFLFKLEDGALIETVIIPDKERVTICLSTQVGCKFRCKFCDSGKNGFVRNLSVAEIISQYLCAALADYDITNIVFMGIGEPLDNFANLIKAIEIFSQKEGLALGKRRISISTCGLIPMIRKLTKMKLGVKLSISLHAANDLKRDQLMPVNKKFPLKELKSCLVKFSDSNSYPVSFEYILMPGFNTDPGDARELGRFVKGLKAKVNLISYNSKDREISLQDELELRAFEKELKRNKVIFTTRKSRGQDINAACGQLKASFNL